MARIPEAEIERLKSEISVQRLVEAAGIELKHGGRDWLGRCPFHEDREASLVVTPAKNLWHCFGCQIGGGPIDWVMKIRGVSFRHAVELLKADPALAAQGAAPVKRTTVRALPLPVALDADDRQLLNDTIAYYHERLKQSPEALAYLKSRGIDHPDLVATFKLGLADRTLGLRLPEKNRKAGADIRARLQKIGLIRESGHEHFNGSLVVPIFDAGGNVVEVYGRKIRDDLRLGTPKHLYLPGPHAGVWNLQAFAASKEIILCEALIDAMSFWCAGYRNVTAAYGVEGFTDELLAAFKQHGTERVLIAYDRDDAGDRASEKLSQRLIAEGIACYRIEFPKGMDANAYALKVTPAGKSLGVAIRKSVWMGQGKAPMRARVEVVAECDHLQEVVPALAAKDETEAAVLPAPAPDAPAEALPASPLPPAPPTDTPAQVEDSEVRLSFGEHEHARRYRVRGLAKNTSPEVLKVNVLAACGETFHVDTLDLYAARARAGFVTQAAIELKLAEEMIRADLGRVLLELERLQDERLREALTPKPVAAYAMSEAERVAALELLRSPDLPARILADFAACGIVGEDTNKLAGYLAATSRKLDSPLAVLVQSSSAAGKSSLMDAVLSLMPEEDRIKYSAVTGQSLFYMGETHLKHKILAIVEEEGASRAAYALKLLQSEGELTIASTGKDAATGNLVTQTYRVEGPVMMFLTTTAIEIDEELLNRCLVLSIDEGRSQTQAIHRLQRERRTADGLAARVKREVLLTVHRNAQRLLRTLAVLNPYARELSFPDGATRTRRDHEKYLTLIDAIALLHQYQRPVKSLREGEKLIEYVEVSLADIALANTLAHEVLGRSLDELPPQTRRLLHLIEAYVAERAKRESVNRSAVRFNRRSLREAIGWGDTQLKIHLARLSDLEYLALGRDKGGAYVYELLYDGNGRDGRPFVPGLIEVEVLDHAYDRNRSGQNASRSGGGRPPVGARSGGGRAAQNAGTPHDTDVGSDLASHTDETQYSGGNGDARSYPHPPLAATA